MAEPVKVYTVNGVAGNSTSSLPDWLTRKRAAKGKGKRAVRERVEGTIDLIQHFEFPEASNVIRTTADGHHAIATGVYKPQMRVWDLDQLTLKFERHTDAENVDFLILSDDWTKTLHLQTDRTIEVHTQGGFYHRVRIPRVGRSLAYHYPSCDALVAASGSEVYRLNLSEGQFKAPLDLSGGAGEVGEVTGVNVADVNPAHQLFAFGVDEGGGGCVQFWDPRARSRVGVLRARVPGMGGPAAYEDSPVTAIASRSDGLSYAIGTSSGHTLLHDIRSSRPYAIKDQGYGLPLRCLSWVEGGGKVLSEGMVISADRKVVKIWDRNSADTNFVSVTPSTDINHIHHVPASGLIMLANEGIQMTAYYIPQLGPAPRWCNFLDNITEEMEDSTKHSVYEDYKFVERSELARLGLDHLVGTPALKPYMHGYFLSLKLYDAARVIANPFVHAEHRERVIKEKMEKLSESRIRTRKDVPKVNKALAEKIRRDEEKELKKEEKRRKRLGKEVAAGEKQGLDQGKQNLLNDDRFKALFEDPEFEVDTTSREYSLLNPSAAEMKRRRTVVDSEEEESDQASSDGLEESHDKSAEESDSDRSSDSSGAGALDPHIYRSSNSGAAGRGTVPPPRQSQQPKLVAMRVQQDAGNSAGIRSDKNASFGDRQKMIVAVSKSTKNRDGDDQMEMSWVPSTEVDEDTPSGATHGKDDRKRRKGMETFGAGMERGTDLDEGDIPNRHGRTRRRTGVRSGSRNVFRSL